MTSDLLLAYVASKRKNSGLLLVAIDTSMVLVLYVLISVSRAPLLLVGPLTELFLSSAYFLPSTADLIT